MTNNLDMKHIMKHIKTFESFLNEGQTALTVDDIRAFADAKEAYSFTKKMSLEELKTFLRTLQDLYSTTREKKFKDIYETTVGVYGNDVFATAIAKSFFTPGTVLRPDVKPSGETAPDRWMRHILNGSWAQKEYNKGFVYAEEFVIQRMARTTVDIEIPLGYFVGRNTKVANITTPVEVKDLKGKSDLHNMIWDVFVFTPEGKTLLTEFPTQLK